MDESELIERAREGDLDAMQGLYRRYSDRVYSVVRRLAGEDALAEDWAQDAWIRAFRGLPSFRGDSRFGTWLHRITVNSALGARRSQARRWGREAPLRDVLPCTRSPDDGLLRMRMERAIAALPAGMRKVLVLHDVEGYTHEEIAGMLEVTSGTCKSQLFKARARLRRSLKDAEEALEGRETCNT
jgi:RNA polymerase sigma-70 factor, ECF subfamily